MGKNLLLWLIIAAVLLTVFNNFNVEPQQEPMAYSEFVKAVHMRQIREAQIQGEKITALDSSGNRISVVWPENDWFVADTSKPIAPRRRSRLRRSGRKRSQHREKQRTETRPPSKKTKTRSFPGAFFGFGPESSKSTKTKTTPKSKKSAPKKRPQRKKKAPSRAAKKPKPDTPTEPT